MSSWRRLRKITGLVLKPVPGIWNRGQSILAALLLVAPSAAPLLHTVWTDVWAVRTGLQVSAVILIALLVRACFRLQTVNDEIMDGRPKLIAKGLSFVDDQPIVNMRTGQIIGKPVFYHLKIENAPTGMVDRHTARKVAGTVVLSNEAGTVVCERKLHRWEQQPSPAEAGKSADLLQALDIPPSGIECKLDIAMKYVDEADFYTPTNQSVQYQGYRDPRYRFGPGVYIAAVRLSGENISTDVRCKIVNKGKGSNLEIGLL